MNKPPFPGMDPYLEGEMWQEFHQTLANQIRAQLMAVLPAKYVALLAKYYVIDHTGLHLIRTSAKQGIYPDIHVAKVKEAVSIYEAVTAPAVELISPVPEKIPALRIEIRDVSERRLVTVIEILSPANKHGKGAAEYLEKRTALLQTETHFLELDLLRGGERISLLGGSLPAAPYYGFLSRFTRRPWTEVWAIQLQEALPTMPVPLLPPDPDLPLALQTAIEACFALVGYQRLLDYHQPPPPPALDEQDLAWVQERIKASSV